MMPLTKDPAYISGRNLIRVSKNTKLAVGETMQTTNSVVEQALGIMGSSAAGYYHGKRQGLSARGEAKVNLQQETRR